ncbi:ribonucleotide-diphosphate reductase subunit beta [compost metagenome]
MIQQTPALDAFDWDRKTQIQTPTMSYTRHYPEIVKLGLEQYEQKLWFSSEMVVERDKMQLLYELSPAQLHAVKTVLQLFLRYELIVGEEFWNGMVIREFPRPEVKMAAAILGCVELATHAEFYNQINQVLGMDKDEDYLAFTNDPLLAARVEWLESVLTGEDKVLATIIFSMTETALLFSSFAILKSFQSNGNNLIPVIARGANQSAIDEDLHGVVSAEIINTRYQELGRALREDTARVEKIYEAVQYAYEHECRIIDMAFLEDKLNGMTKGDFKAFVRYRLNIFLRRIGLDDAFDDETPIKDWFEMNTYAYKMVDFFSTGMGQEYEMGWKEDMFSLAWTEGDN